MAFSMLKKICRLPRCAALSTETYLADGEKRNREMGSSSQSVLTPLEETCHFTLDTTKAPRRRSSAPSQGSCESIGIAEIAETRATGAAIVRSADEDKEEDGLAGSRRSSAASLESSEELANLSGLAATEPGFADLADFNARHGASWADFSYCDDDENRGAFSGHTSRARMISALWKSRRLVSSGIGLDDLIEGDEDESLKFDKACSSSNASESKRGRRRVRFGGLGYHGDIATIREHISIRDMTRAEKHACWYNEYDHAELQMCIIETLNVLRRVSGKREGQDICARGLEHILNEQISEDYERRKNAVIDAVLVEQQAQKRFGGGNVDSNAIAEVSRRMSEKARDEAKTMGTNDEMVAISLLRQDSYRSTPISRAA